MLPERVDDIFGRAIKAGLVLTAIFAGVLGLFTAMRFHLAKIAMPRCASRGMPIAASRSAQGATIGWRTRRVSDWR